MDHSTYNLEGYSFLMSNQLIEAELYKSYSVSYHDSVIFQMTRERKNCTNKVVYKSDLYNIWNVWLDAINVTKIDSVTDEKKNHQFSSFIDDCHMSLRVLEDFLYIKKGEVSFKVIW